MIFYKEKKKDDLGVEILLINLLKLNISAEQLMLWRSTEAEKGLIKVTAATELIWDWSPAVVTGSDSAAIWTGLCIKPPVISRWTSPVTAALEEGRRPAHLNRPINSTADEGKQQRTHLVHKSVQPMLNLSSLVFMLGHIPTAWGRTYLTSTRLQNQNKPQKF